VEVIRQFLMPNRLSLAPLIDRVRSSRSFGSWHQDGRGKPGSGMSPGSFPLGSLDEVENRVAVASMRDICWLGNHRLACGDSTERVP
jgi:hypothetical protein